MALSKDEVRHVANLARMELAEADEERFGGQLSFILDYIGQLNELDTSKTAPTSHALDITNVFRDDAHGRPFGDGVWDSNAPSADHGHFRVPKVLD
ncbi:MAG: Asp-tRNA(Asn)/Glu-tRNA(Gln) amidotransferase subunit GatC [Nitrospinae bacterium]|nr:Asp-tRNA(Asn)/Glu-tRNA(Gln) amidotransferase subunit GatC [Nitrospinota bacterium]